MTPKSLLRLPAASSTMDELESGGFAPVIDDARISDRNMVRRVAVCSGKVFYDLDTARSESFVGDVAVIRLEQFYPFPTSRLSEIFASYPNLAEIVWSQEEPQNMGGWTFVEPRLRSILAEGISMRYIGRDASASPATGSYAIHNLEQQQIVEASLRIDDAEISPASNAEVSEATAPASA